MITTLCNVSLRNLAIYATFLFSILNASCRNNGSSGQVGRTNQIQKTTPKSHLTYKPIYNLYVETSGSMAGYINHPSEFKNTLSGLITDVKTKDMANAININFISGRICEMKSNANSSDIDYFIRNLNPATVSAQNCNSGSSDLPQIFRQVISSNNHSVNVIASDCIFSLHGQNAIEYLEQYKNSIKLFFSDSLAKNPFSTLIIKYTSSFNGIYYNETGSKNHPFDLTNNGIKRPFYVFLIGNGQFIKEFIKNIKYKEYGGYMTSYLLEPPSSNPVPGKTLRFPRQGNYTIKMPATSLEIENAEYGGRTGKSKVFQFSFAANLASCAFDKEYLTNPKNFKLPDNYRIDSIVLVDSTKSAELKGYTHLFSLSTTDLRQNQEVTVALQNKVPDWVRASSTIDDSNIFDKRQQGQTFGFHYLVEGIAGAYDNRFNTERQFAVTIKVSKGELGNDVSRGGINWWVAAVVFLIVGVIIWVKNKS